MSVLFLALLATGQAQSGSQDSGIDIERFTPHSDTYGFANTASATTLSHLQVAVGLWGNYSEDSVVMLSEDGTRLLGLEENGDGVVDNRSVVNFQVGFGLSRFFSIVIDVPFVLWQEGYEPSSADNPNRDTELVSSGLLDARIVPTLAFLDTDELPVGLALRVPIGIPTGEEVSFLGEGGPSVTPTMALEFANGSIRKREYKFRFALNAGYHVRPRSRFRDLIVHNEFRYRAGLGVLPTKYFELGVEASGAAGGPRSAHRPLEILPWVKLYPVTNVSITAGVGLGVLPGLGTPDIRGFLGATLAPSFDPRVRDRDGDGIVNSDDECINVPEDMDGFEDLDGCPEDDNDGDGIVDSDDKCPLVPEDRDGFEDLDGCPDEDNDRDGLVDVVDSCPNDPETYNGFEDDDGCPDDKPIPDTDGDGVLDNVDRCPYEAEDFDSYEDGDGCPDLDNDLDTILDVDDSCPNEPETFNDFQDVDGCPDSVPKPVRVVVEKTKIVINDKIYFETNRATIRSISYDLLNEIAATILDHPDIKRIRVEGHTDSDGTESYNETLSQNRADAVVDYLVREGVGRTRLEAVGFGESQPVASNRTQDGKAANRRVEFIIVERD